MQQINQHIKKVIIAGAGSGDPELITLKALRYLQQADIVMTDRLVSETILQQYIPSGAEVIYVGKQHNNGASISQEKINELLVYHVQLGKSVVRLKGGDVAFFSNVLDELQALTENDIPFEIIPGITAASGASAYAGIPLTARGYATSVRFLTYFKTDVFSAKQWEELAHTDDTLVFYMSSENLREIVDHLVLHQVEKNKLLAVIEQATTPLQKVSVYNLYEFREAAANHNIVTPALLIIGRVVALHENFSWKQNINTPDNYFKPLNVAAHAGGE